MDVLTIMIRHVLPLAAVRAVPAAAATLMLAGSMAISAAVLLAAPSRPAIAQEPPAAAQLAAPHDLLAAAQAKLAFGLIEKLAGEKTHQVTVSPASLASVLDLVSNGGSDKMKEAIARTAGFDKPDGLAALAGVRPGLAGGGDVFTFADRLVFAPSTRLNEDMLANLEKLNVPVDVADLSNAEESKKIDAWVKDVTGGKIPEILGGPVSKTAFAAFNALHFKGKWKNAFDPKQTASAPFTGVEGRSAEVQMMHLPKAVRVFQQEQKGKRTFVGVDLPFADERFALVVVTTREKAAAAKDFAPVAAWLSGSGFKLQTGDLALPRFAASGGGELLPALDSLGLKEARRSAGSLPGFGNDVSLTQVTQRAMIEVDEEGAEAAAATVAIGTRTLEPDESIHMTVDKPFVYALRDKATGLILIAGYIGTAPKGKMS